MAKLRSSLDREAGRGQVRSPVGAQMRHLAGVFPGAGRLAAVLQPGAAQAGVVGQEAGEGAHLGHGQQAAGLERLEDLDQDAIGVGQVVQRVGRPDQVDGPDVRPPLVQVGLDGPDPVGHAQLAGLDPEAVQHRRGRVHGDGACRLEVPEQGEGAGPGPGPQVGDPAGLGGRQPADPVDHAGQVGVQHLGLEVQELGHVLLAVSGAGMMVALVMIMVVDGHDPNSTGTLRY